MPLAHAAPLAVAEAHGLFHRHGLNVRLCRELGWASIREKVLGGELDAAQALAPMPLALTLGLHSARCPAVTALVLNLHGNALVVSRRLWAAGLHESVPLAELARRRGEPFTFAIVYPHSAHAFLLHRWLRAQGLVEGRDVHLVVVPPPQIVGHLRAGHLDGACVGEPWGSLAVRAGVGVIVALSADLEPGHPEKVLMVRESFATKRPGEHLALAAALLEACAWCAEPRHADALAALLAARAWLDVPAETLRPVFSGDLDLGAGRRLHAPQAIIFHGDDVNDPTPARARWIARALGAAPAAPLARVYRTDLFRAVQARLAQTPTPQTSSPLETHPA